MILRVDGDLLDYQSLAGARLTVNCFEAVSMAGVDYSYAALKNVTFHRAEMQKALFCRAILDDVNFNGANLQKADFRESTLLSAIDSACRL